MRKRIIRTGSEVIIFSDQQYDPEFEEIVRKFLCGDVLVHGTLSNVQRALIMLTALTASQTWKPLSKYVQAALDMGAAPEEIKETLYQCAPYIGVEKVKCALDEANRAFQSAGIVYPLEKQAKVTEENRFAKGLAVQQEILYMFIFHYLFTSQLDCTNER